MSLPEQEQWRDIPEAVGRYAVSDRGRVMSYVLNPAGRLMSPQLLLGYLAVGLCIVPGKQESRKVHRLVLTAFDRPPLSGEVARHLNGDALDNRIENLAWGTSSENMQDRVAHGTDPKARRTACSRGHEYLPGSFRPEATRSGVSRRCLQCVRENVRASYQRNGRPKYPCPHCDVTLRRDHLKVHVARHHSALS